MNRLLVFLSAKENNIDIGIPENKIKEIKRTSNKDICIVNGYEIKGKFENIIRGIYFNDIKYIY